MPAPLVLPAPAAQVAHAHLDLPLTGRALASVAVPARAHTASIVSRWKLMPVFGGLIALAAIVFLLLNGPPPARKVGPVIVAQVETHLFELTVTGVGLAFGAFVVYGLIVLGGQ